MSLLKKYSVHIKGITPLIMHSDKLCNPLHPLTKKLKEISCIKQKKDEHHQAMAHIEWNGSLYYDQEELGLYMPSKCLLGCFKSAARKFKKGKDTKGITIDAAIGVPLLPYTKQNPDDLWKVLNKNGEQVHLFCESVVVSRARIMRTRPIFPKWECKFDIYLDTEILSEAQLRTILVVAGSEMGLCELRPEKASGIYGKFSIESMNEI